MKRKLVFLITILSLIGTFVSYAKSNFSDVNAYHWAFKYIDFTADKEIINGFPNGTFMPADPVTKEQSLAMIYRAMKAANILKSTDDYTSKYLDIMNEYNIAEWAHTYVAYALEYNIIAQKELEGFALNEDEEPIGLPVGRQEVAVWAAKAIDRTISPLYFVDYLDSESINSEAIPYIDLMFRHNIMIGDDQNNFRPDSTITRAEFAAVCSRVYNLGSTSSIDTNKEGYTLIGTIKNINKNKISFINEKGIEKIIIISENAGIIINGKESTLNKLEKNLRATISFNNIADNEKILICTEEAVYQGTIDNIQHISDDIYKTTIKNSRNQKISYILDGNSEIYDKSDNKKALRYLTSGMHVKYTCDGVKILEVKID